MSFSTEKKQKVSGNHVQESRTLRKSKIFSPFRVLGNVSNEIPFAVGTLGSTFYVVTSVGRTFHIYDVSNLHLLFVSQVQTPSKITSLACHFHYVYAAYGSRIGIFKRGRLEMELECPGSTTINNLLVFGEYLIASGSNNVIYVFKKSQGSKFANELYTQLDFLDNTIDGDILSLVHPPTYLNKIAVATTQNIYVFNVHTGKLLFKSPDMQFIDSISCIECAPALDILAVGTAKGSVYIYNLKKGTILGPRINTSSSESSSKVVSLSFRTDGTPHIVAGLNTGDLYFYDLEKKSRVHILRNAHKEAYGGVANAKFLNGQPIVLTNGGDNQLKEFVFDPSISASNSSIVSPPRHLRSRGGHSASPVTITFPQEEKSHFMLSASKDRSFWMFSLRKDAQAQEFSQRKPKSKDGKRQGGAVPSMREKFPEIISMATSDIREKEWEDIITAHKDETFARTWDSRNKRVGRHELPTVDDGVVKSVGISQCGNFGLVGSSKGGIGVYNLQSGILRKKYMLHRNTSVTGIAIDGMNRKMVSCGLDGIVGFYDFSQLKYLGKIQLESAITQMIYHKTSDLIACALDDLSIVVIDTVTQQIVRIFYGHSNRITSLDFSPDGRWIVSVALDSTLRTWDIPTGGCIDGVILPNVATCVKFSPIGDFLATTHVTGNGISLWTNRGQFRHISTRHVEEEEFANIFLPNASGDGGSNIIDGALDNEAEEDVDMQTHTSASQIDNSLITLALQPREKASMLVNMESIKQRNKPKEPAKKPEKAPFFLSLRGEAVGDRALVAELGEQQNNSMDTEEQTDSKLLRYNPNDTAFFESKFTKLLKSGAENDKFDEFLQYLVAETPSNIDLEVKSLNTLPPYDEVVAFVRALSFGLKTNENYDLYQAIFNIFIRNHGDLVRSAHDSEELKLALSEWHFLNSERATKIDGIFKYCSGIVNFLSNV